MYSGHLPALHPCTYATDHKSSSRGSITKFVAVGKIDSGAFGQIVEVKAVETILLHVAVPYAYNILAARNIVVLANRRITIFGFVLE